MKSLRTHKEWIPTGLLAVGALVFAILALVAGGSSEILVEWSTASELDTIGYNLYRADSPDGEYVKINPSLIPASTDPQAGGDYSYTDNQVSSGKMYFYELEAISGDGQTERHGPITAEAQSSSPVAWILAAALFLAALITGYIQIKQKRLAR